MMRRQLVTGVLMFLVMTTLLGFAYPLVITGASQVVLSHQANGSIIEREGRPVASELIGQQADGPEWFHPRPSSAGDGYDATSSSGSNLGPTSHELLDEVADRVEEYRSENSLDSSQLVPVDAVTSSGSGLDPHISIANARLQAPRVAAERGLSVDTVLELVDASVQRRPLAVLGDDGVNVVELNLSLVEEGGAS